MCLWITQTFYFPPESAQFILNHYCIIIIINNATRPLSALLILAIPICHPWLLIYLLSVTDWVTSPISPWRLFAGCWPHNTCQTFSWYDSLPDLTCWTNEHGMRHSNKETQQRKTYFIWEQQQVTNGRTFI